MIGKPALTLVEQTLQGLAIAYKLCQMMNGSIIVESEPDAGTTFTVTLPVQQNSLSSEPLTV